jgi:hypothetical protein
MVSSSSRPAVECEEADVNHITLDAQDEAVKRFFLSLPVDPHGSVVELNGRAVACVVPLPAPNGEAAGEWGDEQNERRCDLIDKEIAGTLTPEEAVELYSLQQAMLRHRHRVAPLPLGAAWKLHQELLSKPPRPSSGA